MLRTAILLAPFFVSLFWAITLAGDKKKYGSPRLFLSKFMVLAGLIFISHFLYFAPLPGLYVYFDIPLELTGLFIFPLYHIYFRLLTVDEKFSVKAHGRYLLLPLLVGITYSIGVLITPFDEYKEWLYHQSELNASGAILFLNIARTAIQFTFILVLILSLIGNHRLIRKYGHKAEQFYSDIQDSKPLHANMLNYSILIMGALALFFFVLGRIFLMPKDWLIYSGWSMFTVVLYTMGNLGLKQKMLNPYFEKADLPDDEALAHKPNFKDCNNLAEKITIEFTINKIHLNNELNISDLVTKLGSNRSYISYIINHQFNQNFSSFVNSYRIEELKLLLAKNQQYTNQDLAENCGFGTINSMKRSVYLKTGLSFQDFKML